jgi:hypothetical protein
MQRLPPPFLDGLVMARAVAHHVPGFEMRQTGVRFTHFSYTSPIDGRVN